MSRFLKRGLFIMVVWGLPVVCLALWIWSLIGYIGVDWFSQKWGFGLSISDGGLAFIRMGPFDPWPFPDLRSELPFMSPGLHTRWGFNSGGLRYSPWWFRQSSVPTLDDFFVPGWFITLITLLPAMFIYFPGRRKRRRRKLGLCTRCGYDLRGQSDTAANCPECGTPGAA